MDDDLQLDSDEDLFRNPVYYEPADRQPRPGPPRPRCPARPRPPERAPAHARTCPRREARAHLPRLPGPPRPARSDVPRPARRRRHRPGLRASAERLDSPRNAYTGEVPTPRRYSVGLGLLRPRPRRHRLPASVIRVQKNPIAVQDGNFVLEEGQCSQNSALTRCPEMPDDPENPTDAGYCGGRHRLLVPARQSSTFTGEGGLTLTRFIVEAAAGERIPFQRGGHHGWLPAQQWQQCLEANGPVLDDKERQPSVRQGDLRDRCTEDRPTSEVRAEPKQRRGSRAIVLESRPREAEAARVPSDASGQAIPLCRFGCGQPASLPGPEGLPEHFSCRRKHEA